MCPFFLEHLQCFIPKVCPRFLPVDFGGFFTKKDRDGKNHPDQQEPQSDNLALQLHDEI